MKKVMNEIFDVIINDKNAIPHLESDFTDYFLNDEGNLVLFLTIDDGVHRSHVVKGTGKDFATAANNALNTYKNNVNTNKSPIAVKLDIVTSVRPALRRTQRVRIHSDKITYRRNIDGLAFDKDFNVAFLPEEVRAYQMIQNKKLQHANVFDAFEKHFLLSEQNLVKKFLTAEFFNVYKFRTESWYIDKNEYFPLYRGNRLQNELTKSDLKQSIELTQKNYFRQSVNTQGKFVYIYNPEDNTVPNEYNILRHAGTTYSMLETYELFPDKGLMKAIERSIKYLLKKIQTTTINKKETLVVVEGSSVKLGGNGLTIVALAKYTRVTGDNKYLPIMQKLATWIAETQDEKGEFTKHIQNFNTGKVKGFVSRFYPGEAILALCRLYQIDQNEEWLDVAERAATYLISDRDADENIDTIVPDHWLLYALNDLYRERPKDLYLNHSFFMAQAILNSQNLSPNKNRPEQKGAFGKSRASTPAACKSEGLGAVYRLAKDFGHDSEAEKYKNAINESIKFQLQMQFKPESVMYLTNKRFCLGAFQQGLNNFELRNDYTQHNISSIISFYKILTEYENTI